MRVLPAAMDHLFWEYDARQLSWDRDRDLVIGKVLAAGRWDDIRWLRRNATDAVLRRWIRRHRGRGLTAPQLRYWQLMLDLPDDEVEEWLAEPGRRVWHGRTRRAPVRRRAH